ncbi:MAG: outer membrane beta-barrel protein [Bacteroidales bacterium]|nr:outer membrane beta-barrel protein [Bacteroidales bacterium]
MKKSILTILTLLLMFCEANLFGSNFKGIKDSKKLSLYSLNYLSGVNKLNFPGLAPGKKSSVSYTSKAIYFNITPSSTAIVNKDINDDKNWNVSNGMGVNFEVGYLSKINEFFGFGFGLGNSSYTTELTSSILMYAVNDTDSDPDGDPFSKEISTSEISEKTLINYFDIPIFLEFGNTNIDKVGFYGRIGVKVSFPFSKSLSSSGNVTYEGYYDQYNVVLYDIPELGFESDKEIYHNTKMTLNSVNVSAVVSAGATYPLSNYLIIKFGANANFGLMEISNQKADDYDNKKYDGNYNKLLANPNSKTSTRSYGIEIGLIYNLRLY